MGRARTQLTCTACGSPASQWAGRCPACEAWGTIEEGPPPARPGAGVAPVALTNGGPPDAARLRTGFGGLDRVLGGGLVPGSVVLLAGEPGVGKSTLLLQAMSGLARAGHACLLASGEETHAQVAARAARLGLSHDSVTYVPGRELDGVVGAARGARPEVVVVDSIQSIRDPDHTGLPGGTAQVRVCADALVGLAKQEGIAVVLAGQVTKDGDLAGPRTLEHAVDVVCSFEGDPRTGLRLLAGGKNRFGPEGELAWFEMGADGLHEADPSALLAPGAREAGAATAILSAGRRALAVEIQALGVTTTGPPRRHASGLDPRRFGLVAAVVDRATDLGVGRMELYGASAGGLRITDPGTDLAVAAALASSASNRPPPPGSAFIGEVSLTGAVRSVPNLPARVAAAATAGIEVVYAPPGTPVRGRSGGARIVPVATVAEALAWARVKAKGRDGANGAQGGFAAVAPVEIQEKGL